MSITVLFYGASDDCVIVEGCKGADEFNTYERGPIMWHADLVTADTAVRLYALYGETWSFAVSQPSEDISFPDWPITVKQHPTIDYTTLVEIEVPAGVRLTNVWPEREAGS